jgi:hypothetical protein
VRVAVGVLGAMLVLLLVVVWFALGDNVRGQFTVLQRITLLLFGVLLFACWHALVRSRVTATDAGLTVVNGYRTRRFEWSQVISASLARGAPWATVDLSDGTTVAAMGVQGSDGERARRAIREIRTVIAEHTLSD